MLLCFPLYYSNQLFLINYNINVNNNILLFNRVFQYNEKIMIIYIINYIVIYY